MRGLMNGPALGDGIRIRTRRTRRCRWMIALACLLILTSLLSPRSALAASAAPCRQKHAWASVAQPGTVRPLFRVWYESSPKRNPYVEEDRRLAEALAKELDERIWPTIGELFHAAPFVQPMDDSAYEGSGSDGAYDLCIVAGPPDGLGGPRGFGGITYPYVHGPECQPTPAYTLIHRPGSGVQPATDLSSVFETVAHELTHGMQFAYSSCSDVAGHLWIMEGTAVWAASKVYPGSKWVIKDGHFGDYLYSEDSPIYCTSAKEDRRLPECAAVSLTIQEGNLHRAYATSLFMFQVEKHAGVDGVRNINTTALPASSLEATLEAVDAIVHLDKLWPAFALNLWNQSPHDLLKPWIPATTPAEPHVPLTNEVALPWRRAEATRPPEASFEFPTQALPLRPLSIQYYHLEGLEPDMRSFAFLNTFRANAVIQGDAPRPDVRVLYKLESGELRERDWSDLSVAYLCRDLPDERFTELVLIISNPHTSQVEALPKLSPHIVASNVACAGWTGFDASRGDGLLAATDMDGHHTEGQIEERDEYTSRWELDQSYWATDGGAPGVPPDAAIPSVPGMPPDSTAEYLKLLELGGVYRLTQGTETREYHATQTLDGAMLGSYDAPARTGPIDGDVSLYVQLFSSPLAAGIRGASQIGKVRIMGSARGPEGTWTQEGPPGHIDTGIDRSGGSHLFLCGRDGVDASGVRMTRHSTEPYWPACPHGAVCSGTLEERCSYEALQP